MGFRDTSSKKSSGFKYRKRSKEEWVKQKNQRGGLYDSIIKGDFQTFSAKPGQINGRPLPPTWDRAEHFGLVLWVHYAVGPDENSYLCRERHQFKDKLCPVCDEGAQAAREGNTEYANKCKPTKRLAYWWLDRKHATDGPKVYVAPMTVDIGLVAVCVDEDTNEVLNIDDPDEGFDVSFTRKGEGLKTKYLGFKVARRPSALSTSRAKQKRWLKYIIKHPLPSTLQFYDYDYIKGIFQGKGKRKKSEDGPSTRSEMSSGKKRKKHAKEFLGKSKKHKKHKFTADESLDGGRVKHKKISKKKRKALRSKIKGGFKD